MRTYSLQNGKNLKFVKNDKKRVSIKCVGAGGKCTWYAYCAYMSAINTWQLRKIIDVHTCMVLFMIVWCLRWYEKYIVCCS